MVPNRVWYHYIARAHRAQVICLDCWKDVVARRDGGAFQSEHGLPAGLPGFYPLPPGGYKELHSMSPEGRASFFTHAKQSGHWGWAQEISAAHALREHKRSQFNPELYITAKP